MSNDTNRPLALNIPLIVLWVVAVAVAGLGYWLLQSGNSAQADFYNAQGSDYLQFLNLQTQSTIGGMLLIAGVIGVFIALATHARNRAAAIVAANAAVNDDIDVRGLDEDDESDVADAQRDEEPAAGVDAAASEVSETAESSETTESSETISTDDTDETTPRA